MAALLDWFTVNARDLPWRRTRDPYAIWVSEVMLQQTQVKTVIPYWERWMRELPTSEAVARARPDKIHKLWEGLGYYTRVRSLQKAARQILEKHGGRFPEDFGEVLSLPGIGRYTAGAICSIAFNQPTPILDGNVIRVLTRVYGIGENPREPKTNAALWRLAEELVTRASRLRSRAADRSDLAASQFNQSLMELGALVCAPRNPQCPICPVKKFCCAFRENRVGELPNSGKRVAVTARRFIAFVVERDGRLLVRQRPAGVVNAHLWEFPNVEIGPRLTRPQRLPRPDNPRKIPAPDDRRKDDGSGAPRFDSVAGTALQVLGFAPKQLTPLCTLKHSITRYRIALDAYHLKIDGGCMARPESGRWAAPAGLSQLPFTAAHRKILEELLNRRTRNGSIS